MIEKYKKKVLYALKNDFWSKLIKNVTTVIVGNGGSSIINFVVTCVMIRAVGNTDYGVFLLALQYMNLIDGVVNFQSWAGVIKYGSEAIVEKREDKLAAIFKSGFIIDIATAGLGSIIALLILPTVANFMHWDSNLVLLAALFSVEILFHLEGTSIGILRLYDKFKLTAIQSIVSAILKLTLIGGYFLLGGRSLIVITVLYVITDIFKHMLLVFYALCVLHEDMGIRKVVKSNLRLNDDKFIKYTIWNNFCYTVDVPVKYFDVFIISLISVDMVAIYKVFKQIIQILSMLINPISQAILPQFSELVAQNRTAEALRKVLKLRNVILGCGTIAVVGSLLFGKPIFTWVLGPEYGENLLLFEALFVVQIFLMSYTAIHPFFAALGVPRIDFMITAISNLAYMFVAFVSVKMLGVYSIILAMATQGITLIWLKYDYSKRHFVKRVNDN